MDLMGSVERSSAEVTFRRACGSVRRPTGEPSKDSTGGMVKDVTLRNGTR